MPIDGRRIRCISGKKIAVPDAEIEHALRAIGMVLVIVVIVNGAEKHAAKDSDDEKDT